MVTVIRKVEAEEKKKPSFASTLFVMPDGWVASGTSLKALKAALHYNAAPGSLTVANVDEKLGHALLEEDKWMNPDDVAVANFAHEHHRPRREVALAGQEPPSPVSAEDARALMASSRNFGRVLLRVEAMAYIFRRQAEAPRYGIDAKLPEEIYTPNGYRKKELQGSRALARKADGTFARGSLVVRSAGEIAYGTGW